MGYQADVAAQFVAGALERNAAQLDIAAVGLGQTANDAHESRLACPVWAEQGDDLAPLHGQVYATQYGLASEAFVEIRERR